MGLIGGTWLVATKFQSTAQREAAAKPPEPAAVVTPVKRGDLRDEFTVNAKASGQNATTVHFSVPGEGTTVVTAIGADIAPGKNLRNGQVLLWANDRPVIALDGAFPAYRNLKAGDEGRDVVQLQTALVAIGYEISIDGVLGYGTIEVVNDLYAEHSIQLPLEEKESEEENIDGEAQQSGEAPTKKEKEYEYIIPQAEICFIPSLSSGSIRTNSVPKVGVILDATTAEVQVTNSEIKLSAEVPGTVAAALTAGLHASFVSNQVPVELVIKEIVPIEEKGNKESGQGQPNNNSMVTFESIDGPLPDGLKPDEEILVTVSRIQAIEDTLIVPKRSISAMPDSKTFVLKKNKDGNFIEVEVTELACVAGECAVKAKEGDLNENDHVRVDTP